MLNIRFREKTNAWPGFVDLFSNLVIILIFLLIVFVFLWTTTSVFNKNTGAKKVAELQQVQQAQAEQIEQMNADKQEAEQLLIAARDALENQEAQIANQQIQAENLANAYENQIAEQQKQAQEIVDAYEDHIAEQKKQTEELSNAYEDKITILTMQQAELANQIAALTEQLQLATHAKDEMARMESERHEMQDDMSEQRSILNARIAELEAQLDAAEAAAKEKEAEYTQMSNRLNTALAEKVAELNEAVEELDALAEYQSEFYKQVKIALGDRTTIIQDGDRFIISSDILFPSGSYKISADGQAQLRLLANVIKDFENKIPTDIDWIIRVDGHTDNKPVLKGTKAYRNNMQLSLLRATAVIDELVKNGVSKRRLIPTGFGDLHPIALGSDRETLQRNRRIELQLTNR